MVNKARPKYMIKAREVVRVSNVMPWGLSEASWQAKNVELEGWGRGVILITCQAPGSSTRANVTNRIWMSKAIHVCVTPWVLRLCVSKAHLMV